MMFHLPRHSVGLRTEEELTRAVNNLMACAHGHWFAVQKEERVLWVNDSGLKCALGEALT